MRIVQSDPISLCDELYSKSITRLLVSSLVCFLWKITIKRQIMEPLLAMASAHSERAGKPRGHDVRTMTSPSSKHLKVGL